MKVLVTGGAGFIGSHIAERLLKMGNDVTIVDNFNDYYSPEEKLKNVTDLLTKYRGLSVLSIDILSEDFSKLWRLDFDVVVHLAAQAGVRTKYDDEYYFNQNFVGTNRVAELVAKINSRGHECRLFYASSSSVYGNCKADKFSEGIEGLQPISMYGKTKLACERLIASYVDMLKFTAVGFRFFTVYGSRMRPDLAIRKFAEAIDKTRRINIYGDGHNVRDYTHVSDIVDGVVSAIYTIKDKKHHIYNLGGGNPVSINGMLTELRKNLKGTPIICHVPMHPNDVDKTVCDYSLAKKELGYEPKMSFSDGIAKFCKWYREYKDEH